MKTNNLLLECKKANLIRMRDSGLAQKALDECRQRFTIFHILNYIMYTDALEAFDVIETSGMMKMSVRQHRNSCEKVWSSYQHTLRQGMNDDAWYLLQDYCMAAYDGINDKSEMMRLCFTNYLLKNKCKNYEAIAMLGVSLKVADVITLLWDTYFSAYKKICGFDFSEDFAYADLRKFIYHLQVITNTLSRGNVVVDFSKDLPCLNAMRIYENYIIDEDFQDEAARKAIEYSKKYSKLYAESIKKK